MRSWFPAAVLAPAVALCLPCFASTVRHRASGPIHRHRIHHHAVHHAVVAAHHRRAKASVHPAALETDAPRRASAIPAVARVRFVPPMRGSRASLLRQNERNAAEGLVRIQDDEQLNQLRDEHELVMVPVGASLRVNPDLPYNRRYCRSWTAQFLNDLARVHYVRFHRPLQVNSAVRTVAFQRELMGTNGNAAAADGDLASPHLTGAAVDIGKKGLTLQEIAWMRAWLLPLQQAGKIDVEEEFYQACFHITVYSKYETPVEPVVPHRRAGATLLATGVR